MHEQSKAEEKKKKTGIVGRMNLNTIEMAECENSKATQMHNKDGNRR